MTVVVDSDERHDAELRQSHGGSLDRDLKNLELVNSLRLTRSGWGFIPDDGDQPLSGSLSTRFVSLPRKTGFGAWFC